jgi:hypothetical protein
MQHSSAPAASHTHKGLPQAKKLFFIIALPSQTV